VKASHFALLSFCLFLYLVLHRNSQVVILNQAVLISLEVECLWSCSQLSITSTYLAQVSKKSSAWKNISSKSVGLGLRSGYVVWLAENFRVSRRWGRMWGRFSDGCGWNWCRCYAVCRPNPEALLVKAGLIQAGSWFQPVFFLDQRITRGSGTCFTCWKFHELQLVRPSNQFVFKTTMTARATRNISPSLLRLAPESKKRVGKLQIMIEEAKGSVLPLVSLERFTWLDRYPIFTSEARPIWRIHSAPHVLDTIINTKLLKLVPESTLS